ncbi:protein mono-ADP-ribosyltransferase PARP15 isoform X2 [Xenopus laevis]|uniref:Poly [ADP-ribose] polymerase n=1 Tax=Xenopus laevis TaxID=8355 RepID=A0A8J0TXC6_XENLA|nr:protein mono-ADP-ribosyltransferase PARP15 isoform X2 [Xenopus laevis]
MYHRLMVNANNGTSIYKSFQPHTLYNENMYKEVSMNELVIGQSIVMLKKGDITEESTDAIVNINNYSLVQNFGVSKDILAAAGDIVKGECSRLGQQPHGDVVETGAGNLNCSRIIHLIGATTWDSIMAGVKKILEKCDQLDLISVAFPALGTGTGGISAKRSMEAILTAIEEYLSRSTTSSFLIYIVAFTQHVYQEYLNVFESRMFSLKKLTLHDPIYGSIVEIIREDITTLNVDCIVNLNNATLDRIKGVSGPILSAAGANVKNECKTMGGIRPGKMILTSGGNLRCKKILHLIGPTRAADIALSLDQILQECEKYALTTIALPVIGTGEASIDPNDAIQEMLEGLNQYFQIAVFTSIKKIYIIAFTEEIYQIFQIKISHLQATDMNLGFNVVEANNPPTWTAMGTSEYLIVELPRDSTEFKTIENDFLNSAKPLCSQVIKIKRVQNVKLWRIFEVQKEYVQSCHPNQQNHRCLYHGSSEGTVAKISKFGFNRSFCGRNATRYGKGTYFAKHASYSCDDLYSVPDENRHKHIILASVITGKWCLGKRHYLEPPPMEDNPNLLYNCVVDHVSNPDIFVIFSDYGAYPEYLITCR